MSHKFKASINGDRFSSINIFTSTAVSIQNIFPTTLFQYISIALLYKLFNSYFNVYFYKNGFK